jgi:hypothetical protein
MNPNDEAPLWAKVALWASILMLLGVLMWGCSPSYQPPAPGLEVGLCAARPDLCN